MFLVIHGNWVVGNIMGVVDFRGMASSALDVVMELVVANF